MKIGVIVAMGKELKLLRPLIERQSETELNGFCFIEGKIGSHDVVVMQCGIGKVNSAIGTLSMIDNFTPDLIINTGVAGGADYTMRVLDLLVADGIAYHDVWCGPGTEYGAASGYPRIMRPEPKILDVARQYLKGDKVKYGLICSGDKFISTAEEVKKIKSDFTEALAVDMESASIAQVCHLKRVPVAILRVISDTPGAEENISQYENFWTDAPAETFKALIEILKHL